MCCGKTELENFLTKLKLKPLSRIVFMICKVSLIRTETITAFNWDKGSRETTFLPICQGKGPTLCPSFVLNGKKKSQIGVFSWECIWAGTHTNTCTYTRMCAHTPTPNHLFHKNFGCRKVKTQVDARLTSLITESQGSLSLWPLGHLLWIKSCKGQDLITSGSTSNWGGFSQDCQAIQLEVIKRFRDKMD